MKQGIITHFYSDLLGAWQIIMRNKKQMLLQCLVDLGFIIGFFSLFYTFYLKIIGRLSYMVQVADKRGQEALSALTTKQFAISMEEQALFMQNYNEVIKLFFIFVLCISALYILLHGFNWYMANIITGKAKGEDKASLNGLLRYLQRFSLISLIWLAGLLAIMYLCVGVLFWNSQGENPIFNQSVLNYLTIIILMCYSYFAAVSYVLISEKGLFTALKDSFTFGIRRLKDLCLQYLSAGALIVALFLIAQYISYISIPGSTLIGLVCLPVMFFGKTIICVSVKRVIVKSASESHHKTHEKEKKAD